MTSIYEKLNKLSDKALHDFELNGCELNDDPEDLSLEEKCEFLNLTPDERKGIDEYGHLYLYMLDYPFLSDRIIDGLLKLDKNTNIILSEYIYKQYKDYLLPEDYAYIEDVFDSDESLKNYLERRQKSNSSKTPEFDDKIHSAEIHELKDDKGNICILSNVNGKKHGAVILFDKDRNVKKIKLYNMGEELDINKHKVDIKTKKIEKNGETQYGLSIMLDDKPFGQQILTHNDNRKTGFYDINGNEMIVLSDDLGQALQINCSSQQQSDEAIRNQLQAVAQKNKNNALNFESKLNQRHTKNSDNTRQNSTNNIPPKLIENTR